MDEGSEKFRETQQSGHAPRSGPEIKSRKSSAKDVALHQYLFALPMDEGSEKFRETQQSGHAPRSGPEI